VDYDQIKAAAEDAVLRAAIEVEVKAAELAGLGRTDVPLDDPRHVTNRSQLAKTTYWRTRKELIDARAAQVGARRWLDTVERHPEMSLDDP
jgi:hypothetical protein